ncbi:MAG: hypothetical protein QXO15_12090 [Nitrososphaerota archaeon]
MAVTYEKETSAIRGTHTPYGGKQAYMAATSIFIHNYLAQQCLSEIIMELIVEGGPPAVLEPASQYNCSEAFYGSKQG